MDDLQSLSIEQRMIMQKLLISGVVFLLAGLFSWMV